LVNKGLWQDGGHYCTKGKKILGAREYMFAIKGTIDGNQH
jgi:hypothetical protein